MMKKLFAAICTGALAGLCVSTRATAMGVPVVIDLPSGGNIEYVFEDRDIEFRTNAGRIRLKPSALVSIAKEPLDNIYRLTTTAGDVWLAQLPAKAFSYYPAEDPREKVAFDGPFTQIRNKEAPTPIAPPFACRIELRDGGILFSDLRDVRLRVENDSGEWDFPVGACSSITFARQAASDKLLATIKFGTGQIEHVSLPGRSPSLTVPDQFGNQLDLAVEILQRITILSPSGGEPDAPLRGLDGSAGRIFVAGTRGEVFTVSSPMIVWSLEMEARPVPLPSNNLRSIRKNPNGEGFIVETVYGERFTGALRPEDVPLPRDRNDYHRLRLDKQQSVSFLNAFVTIPPGYLVWRLRDGSAFCARFAVDSLALNVTGGGAVTRYAQSHITFLRGGEPLSVMLDDKDLVLGQPTTSRAELVLLTSASTVRIPWSEVEYAMGGLATVSREMRIPPAGETPVETADNLLSRLFRTVPPTEPTTAPGMTAAEAYTSPLEGIDFENAETRRALEGGSPSDFVRHTLILLDHAVSLYCQEREAAGERMAQADDELRNLNAEIAQLTNTIASLQTDLPLGQERQDRLRADRDQERETSRVELNRLTGELNAARETIGQLETDKAAALAVAEATRAQRALAATEVPSASPAQTQPESKSASPSEYRRVAARDPNNPDELLVYGATFDMGRQRGPGRGDETPVVNVTLAAFYISDHEVTRAEFTEFVRASGFTTDAEEQKLAADWARPGFEQTDDEPVVFVSWFDAINYCNWRSQKAGLAPCYELKRGQRVGVDLTRNGYRLPSEAEWEFAARNGGQDVIYPWGDDETEAIRKANFRQEEGEASDGWEWTNPVKAIAPNRIGLYGMAGNVWEWCSDWYVEDAYATALGDGRVSPFVGDREISKAGGQERRSMRGGSFLNGLSMLRCSCRGNGVPSASAGRVGFRLARNASPAPAQE